MKNKTLYSLLYYLELYWLLIDTINGITIRYYSFSFGAIVRGLGVLLFFFIILSNKSKGGGMLLFFIFILLFQAFIQLFIFDNITIISGLDSLIKLLLLPQFLLVLPIQCKVGTLSEKKIIKIIFFNFAVFAINIISGFFGLGFSNYVTKSGDFGSTGFFYAGNEVGGTFLILMSLIFALFYNKKTKLFVLGVLSLVLAITIASKSAILGILIILFFMYIKRKAINFVFILTIISGAFFYFYDNIQNLLNGFFTRIHYFGDNYGYETLFLGGQKRIGNIQAYISTLSQHPLYLISGMGWSGESENNFFDLLEAYGLIGLIFFIIILFLSKKLFKSHNNSSSNFYLPLRIGIILILIVSVFAGHILQSAMMSLFIALCIVMGSQKCFDPQLINKK